jgi:hypothetical protein
MHEVRVLRPDSNGAIQYSHTIGVPKLLADLYKNEDGSSFINPQANQQLHTSKCEFCKKEFQSKKKNQRWCPPLFMRKKESCSYLADKESRKKPMVKKECFACHKPFETRLPQQIMCGDPCTAQTVKITRQKCACGREFRTHRKEIQSCTRCR